MNAPELVLVTGPPRAGVTAMVAELRRRLPSHRVAEPGDLTRAEEPAAVVFVASAVAPIVESDCASLDFVTDTVAVIAVVAKIDDHRDWRRVLSADRELLGRQVPWVGAAAAPRLGEPTMDELVGLLQATLGDRAGRDRNALRAKEYRVDRLRQERETLMRRRRLAALERARMLRCEVQESRLALTHAARRRCVALRAELVDEAAAVSRTEVAAFPRLVRQRCRDVLADVGADIAAHTREVTSPAVPAFEVTEPPLRSRRLENRLMTVLGVGFGLGIALVVTRLVAGLAPGLAVGGLAAGSSVGLATTVWVIRTRALLHDRAVLQAWAGEAAAAVRAAAEEQVATSMLAAESAMAAAHAAADADEDAESGQRIAAIDAELRQLLRSLNAFSLLPAGRQPGNELLNRSCE